MLRGEAKRERKKMVSKTHTVQRTHRSLGSLSRDTSVWTNSGLDFLLARLPTCCLRFTCRWCGPRVTGLRRAAARGSRAAIPRGHGIHFQTAAPAHLASGPTRSSPVRYGMAGAQAPPVKAARARVMARAERAVDGNGHPPG